jgi:8-oxo-dGTP pyrophosphatase MutT (NUDIX family)
MCDIAVNLCKVLNICFDMILDMDDTTRFQYCQKLVICRKNGSEVLLAKRQGEADYDATYTFIGGKMETTDRGIVEGLLREKCEEIGTTARIRVCPHFSYNVHFVKKDNSAMILPHYYAEYIEGAIVLSEEYSDYQWVPVAKLQDFEPKIANIPEVLGTVLRIKALAKPADFVEI